MTMYTYEELQRAVRRAERSLLIRLLFIIAVVIIATKIQKYTGFTPILHRYFVPDIIDTIVLGFVLVMCGLLYLKQRKDK